MYARGPVPASCAVQVERLHPVAHPIRCLRSRNWQAVVRVWYDDAAFGRPHRCAAVRGAIERLTSTFGHPHAAYGDMRALERRTCG